MQLKESSKIKSRAKVIFGTGDQLKAVTMTSNIGFVRSAEQQVSITFYFCFDLNRWHASSFFRDFYHITKSNCSIGRQHNFYVSRRLASSVGDPAKVTECVIQVTSSNPAGWVKN
jgi:hypothetical protein